MSTVIHPLTEQESTRWDCVTAKCGGEPVFVFVTHLGAVKKKQAYCATHAKAVAKKLKLELPGN